MKKAWALLLVLFLLLTLCACIKKEETVSAPESYADILGPGGELLGQIDGRAFPTAADRGIFYSVFAPGEGKFTSPAAYHFFDAEKRTDVLLGTLENQGYEAAFARTELDGVIYSLAVTGNVFGSAPTPLLLLSFDLNAGTMREYTVSKTGFPYAAMAAVNGRLVIMNHEMTEPKTDSVYEFDPATGNVRQVLTFDAEKDSLRSVAATKNGFCLLRLSLQDGAVAQVFLDRFTADGEKLSSADVTRTLSSAIETIGGISGTADAMNELGMNVSRFVLQDDRYLVYENFGLSRVALDLETGEVLFAGDDEYGVSPGNGAPVFYRTEFEAQGAGEHELFELRQGKTSRFAFSSSVDGALLQSVSRSPGGTVLVTVSDRFPLRDAALALYLLPTADD